MRITRRIPRHAKEMANEKEHFINPTTMLAKRGNEQNTQVNTFKGTCKNEGKVHAVTYDENDYAWDATTTDTSWYPHAGTHTEWERYIGWEHVYPQYGNWFEGFAPQVQNGGKQPWIQNSSATPVQNTVNGLRSSLSSGSTSACAIEAQMSTRWTTQKKKLNSILLVESTLATMKSPDYMMFDAGAAVHVCPHWFCNDYPV